ncbi:MAG: MBL fold metallo-hydrolase [candidate division KSB1 bacterium]|nr:MBL fold metallo-hydrolase [candidate division KSB1 bacterium]MDZ7303881.1 MBL fold metallo-hydrolase [candidate division KSB1 bacterium]MDZ7313195.1 MBL fold metallo-hydrolase [candidate division KSB1 bacterium]
MRIRFCGAAQEVTGSQHLVSVNGKNLLLDCGTFQGRREESRRKNENFKFDPARVDQLILSHAHIDHSGNIPALVKKGFTGHVFSTRATVDLCNIMLRDSAHLQEKDAEWLDKKRHEHIEPLYDLEDVERAMQHFVGLQYLRPFPVAPGVQVTFQDAGHILGSAGVLLEIEERGGKRRLGFSGDLGRRNMPILKDPDYLDDLDILIMESTYGNREHPDIENMAEELAKAVRAVHRRGGKIIVPAFSIGRTQALVYYLHKLWNQNRIPDLPIYVDSPLSVDTTSVHRLHPECFDRETQRLFLDDGQDPFGFKRLIYVRDVEDSKKLNDLDTPCMIISASGMAEGGRILHHLKNNIGDPRHCVLIIGYMAENTLGRRLAEGATEVKIFGEIYTRRCEVRQLDGFSAHADRSDLLDFVRRQNPKKLRHIFLVHGEPEQAEPLAEAIRSLGFRNVHIPQAGEEFDI